VPEETRAEIARRRLAQLAAAFDADLPPADEPEPVRRRVGRPHVRVVATIGVAAAVLLGWWLLSGRPETSGPQPLAFPTTAGAPAPSATTAGTPAGTGAAGTELVVDVVGKVRRPGIVTLPPGSRVHEAIDAAGGLKGRVDTTALNMARLLVDGEQVLVGIEPVVVPADATTSGGGGGSGGGATAGGAPVNLNTATEEQLDTLPGVGPVTAQAILDWRAEHGRFATVDDLLDVKGIGEATLADLRDLVTV
jgi:competence protein ComEA